MARLVESRKKRKREREISGATEMATQHCQYTIIAVSRIYFAKQKLSTIPMCMQMNKCLICDSECYVCVCVYVFGVEENSTRFENIIWFVV